MTMSDHHVLIVEDERKIATLLRDYLESSGFKTTLEERGDTAVSLVRKTSFSLILLDLMLPGMEGADVCSEIRKFSNIPIIMITAKVEEIDRIIGLEIGADDYICKPFSPREVVARVKAVLRRYRQQTGGKNIAVGPLRIDDETREVSVNGTSLKLTPSEYNILKILLSRPHRVFTRAELIDQVFGYNFEGYERTIDSHIKNLRKKLSVHLPDADVIESVYGVGYKLVPPGE